MVRALRWAACLLLVSAVARADGPLDAIRYAGHLDWDNKPFTGSVAIKAHLYADAQAATSLWSDEWAAVPVYRGAFVLLLGAKAPLGNAVGTKGALYLGLEVKRVGIDPEYVALTGTQRLNALPRALATPFVVDVEGTIAVQTDAIFEGDAAVGGDLTVKGAVTADSYPTLSITSTSMQPKGPYYDSEKMAMVYTEEVLADMPAGSGFCFLTEVRILGGTLGCSDSDGCPYPGECRIFTVGTEWRLTGLEGKAYSSGVGRCGATCIRWK